MNFTSININEFPAQIFLWSRKNKTAVIDLSQLNAHGLRLQPKENVVLYNNNKGTHQLFKFKCIDFADVHNEDIAGYRYTTSINNEQWTLIFIND